MIKSFNKDISNIYTNDKLCTKIYSLGELVYETNYMEGIVNAINISVPTEENPNPEPEYTVSFNPYDTIYYLIDWGDGTVTSDTKTHTYSTGGEFNIKVYSNLDFCFREFTALKHINILKTGQSSCRVMFYDCINLESIDELVFSNTITSFDRTFLRCYKLKSIPCTLELSEVTDLTHAFNNTTSLSELDIITSDKLKKLDACFFNSGITQLSFDTFITSGVTSWYQAFSNAKFTELNIDVSSAIELRSSFSGNDELITLTLTNAENVESLYYLLAGCDKIKNVYIDDTSSVTNFSYMFYNSGIEVAPELNLISALDTTYMFTGCSQLTTVLGYNMSNVQIADAMFTDCVNLQTLSELDMSSLKEAMSMFSRCQLLDNLTLRNLGNLESLGKCFYNIANKGTCGGLFGLKKSVDLSITGFDSESIVNIFESLPIIETSEVIYIKDLILSEEQKLIATNKGWTVVQKSSLPELSGNYAYCIIDTAKISDENLTISYDGVEGQFDTIDWGDGTITNDIKTHTYTTKGSYLILINAEENRLSLENFSAITEIVKIDVSSQTDISNLLSGLISLNHIPQLDFSSAIVANNVFSGNIYNQGTRTLSLNSFTTTPSLVDCERMFFESQYQSVNIVTDSVTNFKEMFKDSTILSNIQSMEMGNATNVDGFVDGCRSLSYMYSLNNLSRSLDLSASSILSPSAITNVVSSLANVTDNPQTLTISLTTANGLDDATYIAARNKGWTILPDRQVSSINSVDASLQVTSGETVIYNGEVNTRSVNSITIDWGDGTINNETTHSYLEGGNYNIKITTNSPLSMKNMSSLVSVNKLNTSQTSYNSMFKDCSNLVDIGLLNLTSSVDNSNLFEGCLSLEKVDICGVSLGIDLGDCSKLNNLDVMNVILNAESLNNTNNIVFNDVALENFIATTPEINIAEHSINYSTRAANITPTYVVENQHFNGTRYIDTGINLFDTPKPFSIVIKYNWDMENIFKELEQYGTVLHCMKEVDPYPGLTIQGYRSTSTNLLENFIQYNSEINLYNLNSLYSTATSDSKILIFTRDIEGNCTIESYNHFGGVLRSKESYVDVYSDSEDYKNSRLILGASDMNGTIDRFMSGSIELFEYYGAVLTEDEIEVIKQKLIG